MQEMNEYMLAKWNRKIRPNDDVVILGDLSLGSATETSGLIKRLNGRLYLIKGNHDRYLDDKKADFSRFIWVKPYEELSDNKRSTITVNAQGEERPIPCNMINCFCMYSNYEPLTLDEWIENSSNRHGFFKLT